MAQTLEEQIADRKQRERGQGIYEKASDIVRKLGTRDDVASTGGYDYQTDVYVFNDAASSLQVRRTDEHSEWDEYANNWYAIRVSLDISLNGKEVFNWSREKRDGAYIPGAWEARLDALHAKADPVQAAKFAEKAAKSAEKAHTVAAERQRDLKKIPSAVKIRPRVA